MADQTVRAEFSDEYDQATRLRSEALTAAVTLLQGYVPTEPKTRSGVALSVARNFESYLRGST